MAGCGGDHAVSNVSVPDGAMTEYALDDGISWLTIVADAPPPHAVMGIGGHGYAAQYARGPKSSRFYLQGDPLTGQTAGPRTGSGHRRGSGCTSLTCRAG